MKMKQEEHWNSVSEKRNLLRPFKLRNFQNMERGIILSLIWGADMEERLTNYIIMVTVIKLALIFLKV